MKEMIQAGNFFDSLDQKSQKDLTEAVAESLFFQEEALQKAVIDLLEKADPRLSRGVAEKVMETALQ